MSHALLGCSKQHHIKAVLWFKLGNLKNKGKFPAKTVERFTQKLFTAYPPETSIASTALRVEN
jgi:hypothetical protein